MNPRRLTRLETSERRKQMKIFCVAVKIQENKLSEERRVRLDNMFKHAKYLYSNRRKEKLKLMKKDLELEDETNL